MTQCWRQNLDSLKGRLSICTSSDMNWPVSVYQVRCTITIEYLLYDMYRKNWRVAENILEKVFFPLNYFMKWLRFMRGNIIIIILSYNSSVWPIKLTDAWYDFYYIFESMLIVHAHCSRTNISMVIINGRCLFFNKW